MEVGGSRGVSVGGGRMTAFATGEMEGQGRFQLAAVNNFSTVMPVGVSSHE